MSETFEFIDAEYAHGSAQDIPTVRPSVAAMCVWLGVSRSGYYEWRDRPESATARRREELKHLIIVSFEESDGTYGYRRVHADLAAWGVTCGPELVRSMMRELGLVPCQPRPWRHSPDRQRRPGPASAGPRRARPRAVPAGKLGLEVRTDAEMALGRRWLEVAPKGSQTSFALLRGTDFEKQTLGGPAPATLRSPDVRALYTELTAKGVDVSEPKVEPWSTWVEITDPDGWRFVVGESS